MINEINSNADQIKVYKTSLMWYFVKEFAESGLGSFNNIRVTSCTSLCCTV